MRSQAKKKLLPSDEYLHGLISDLKLPERLVKTVFEIGRSRYERLKTGRCHKSTGRIAGRVFEGTLTELRYFLSVYPQLALKSPRRSKFVVYQQKSLWGKNLSSPLIEKPRTFYWHVRRIETSKPVPSPLTLPGPSEPQKIVQASQSDALRCKRSLRVDFNEVDIEHM
jgi:hypothetical protein